MKSTKAQGLPVNIVVMMIIGIVLFGLGMSLFFKISSAGEDSIDDLNNQIKSDIASLECSGTEWVCTPSHKMRNGGKETFEIFIANREDSAKEFTVDIQTEIIDPNDPTKLGINSDCGSILLSSPSITTNVRSGFSASYPFIVRASRVEKTPCTFVTSVTLTDDLGIEKGKTPLIIRVE